MTQEEFKKEYQELRQQERDTNKVMSDIYSKKQEIRKEYFKEHSDWFDKKYVKIQWNPNDVDYLEIVSKSVNDIEAIFETKCFNVISVDGLGIDGVVTEIHVNSNHSISFSIKVDDNGDPEIKLRNSWPWNKGVKQRGENPVITYPDSGEWVSIRRKLHERLEDLL